MGCMTWKETRTAIVAGVVVLVILAIIAEAVKKHAEATQSAEDQSHAGTTKMQLTGTSGASVIGLYVQNGEMVMVSNSLPWSFAGTNISLVEFQKVKPADMIAIQLVYDGPGVHAGMTQHLDARITRVEVRVKEGFIATLHEQ